MVRGKRVFRGVDLEVVVGERKSDVREIKGGEYV